MGELPGTVTLRVGADGRGVNALTSQGHHPAIAVRGIPKGLGSALDSQVGSCTAVSYSARVDAEPAIEERCR